MQLSDVTLICNYKSEEFDRLNHWTMRVILTLLGQRLLGSVENMLRPDCPSCVIRCCLSVISIFRQLLLWSSWTDFNHTLYLASWSQGNRSLFQWWWSVDQGGHLAHIWQKPFENFLFQNRETESPKTWYKPSIIWCLLIFSYDH